MAGVSSVLQAVGHHIVPPSREIMSSQFDQALSLGAAGEAKPCQEECAQRTRGPASAARHGRDRPAGRAGAPQQVSPARTAAQGLLAAVPSFDTNNLKSHAQHHRQGLCFRGLVQSSDCDAEMACRCCPAVRSSTPVPTWGTSTRWVRCVRRRAVDPSEGHRLEGGRTGTNRHLSIQTVAFCQHPGPCGCRTRLWTSCRWAG